MTLKVVNGAWDDDGTKEDRIVTLGEDRLLNVDDIPDVGGSPDEGYEMGAWEVEPPLEEEITEDVTYTYIYAEVNAAEAEPGEEPGTEPDTEPDEEPGIEAGTEPGEEPGEEVVEGEPDNGITEDTDEPAEELHRDRARRRTR